MYASSSLRWVHGVGISQTKSNSIADLICATLLMPGKTWSSHNMYKPKREISESDSSDNSQQHKRMSGTLSTLTATRRKLVV